MINKATLTNGLRIIHHVTDSEVVHCGYAINAGSRDEQDGEDGIAHFCEHMSFKGTATRSAIQIINELERVGGELNAFTTKEETFYYAAVLRKYFNKATDLLTDIVFCSTYQQHAMEKEKEVVCDEIDSYLDSPAELIYDEFENYLMQGHPLGHNVLGDKEKVRGFTTESCLRFTRRLYCPANAVFYVDGNISFNALVARLEKLTSGINRPFTKTPKVCECNNVNRILGTEKIIDEQTHQSHVLMGTALTGDFATWRIPLFVLNNMLGGPSMNSRLNLSLRERCGLVYTVESTMSTYRDALIWAAYFGCDPHDMRRCQRLVYSELHKLQKKPLSEKVLNAVKKQMKGQIVLAGENRENFAINMAKQYLQFGTEKNLQRLCDKIDKVTPEQIHYLACNMLSDDKIFKCIIK